MVSIDDHIKAGWKVQCAAEGLVVLDKDRIRKIFNLEDGEMTMNPIYIVEPKK